MFRGGRLKNREVIDMRSAQRIGYVYDIEIDENNGMVTAIVVMQGGLFRRMFNIGEIIIPWSSISAISEEYVLTDMYTIQIK